MAKQTDKTKKPATKKAASKAKAEKAAAENQAEYLEMLKKDLEEKSKVAAPAPAAKSKKGCYVKHIHSDAYLKLTSEGLERVPLEKADTFTEAEAKRYTTGVFAPLYEVVHVK